MSKIAVITTRCDALLASGETCQVVVDENGDEHQVIVLNDSSYEMDLCKAHQASFHAVTEVYCHGFTYVKPEGAPKERTKRASPRYRSDDVPCPYCPPGTRNYARLGQHIAKMHPEHRGETRV